MTGRGLLLDLDDTLYPEESYVRSGYRAVARHVASLHPGLDADAVFARLWYEFRRYGRLQAFDRTLAHLGLDRPSIPELVEVYRSHEPEIQLYPGVRETLSRLAGNWRLAIVTDGHAGMQRRKVEALQARLPVSTVIYCHEIGAPKPDPKGLILAAERLGVPVSACVMVGDDPYLDVPAARAAGIPCIRVRTGRAREVPLPADRGTCEEVDSFSAVPAVLQKLAAGPAPE